VKSARRLAYIFNNFKGFLMKKAAGKRPQSDMRSSLFRASALSLCLALSACGSNETSTETSATATAEQLAESAALLKAIEQPLQGVFVDAPVQGLGYKTTRVTGGSSKAVTFATAIRGSTLSGQISGDNVTFTVNGRSFYVPLGDITTKDANGRFVSKSQSEVAVAVRKQSTATALVFAAMLTTGKASDFDATMRDMLSNISPSTSTSEMSYTDASGGYTCKAGEDVEFFLGNLSLGAVKCAGTVNVFQLVGAGDSQDKGLRIAQLLQSLNTSGDPTRIVLPTAARTASLSVNLTGTEAEFEASAKTLFAAAGKPDASLVDRVTAANHVKAELQKLSQATRDSLCTTNTCGSNLLPLLNAAPTNGLTVNVNGLPSAKSLIVQLLVDDEVKGTKTVSSSGAVSFGNWPETGKVDSAYSIEVAGDSSFSCTIDKASGAISPLTASGQVAATNNVTANVTCVAIDPPRAALAVRVDNLADKQSIQLSYGASVCSTAETITVSSNGEARFAKQLLAQESYIVAVPSTCKIAKGEPSGKVPALSGNIVVRDLVIDCMPPAPKYSLRGSVTGLAANESVSLSVIVGSVTTALSLTTNGEFSASTLIANSTAYDVSVSGASTTTVCAIDKGKGSIAGADVSDLKVTCVPKPPVVEVPPVVYNATVSGAISGLVSNEIASLTLNNTTTSAVIETLLVGANGNFAFVNKLAAGTAYAVVTPPNCVINTGGSGVVTSPLTSNVSLSSLSITCTAAPGGGGGGIPPGGGLPPGGGGTPPGILP
jgi:hypothetical protein